MSPHRPFDREAFRVDLRTRLLALLAVEPGKDSDELVRACGVMVDESVKIIADSYDALLATPAGAALVRPPPPDLAAQVAKALADAACIERDLSLRYKLIPGSVSVTVPDSTALTDEQKSRREVPGITWSAQLEKP